MKVIETFLLVLTLASTMAIIIATLGLFRMRPKKYRKRLCPAGISIIKPIRGLEAGLKKNLESFFLLKANIPFELLLSVKNPLDPAVKIIHELMAEHPLVDCKLLTGTPDIGLNPKVNNMQTAWTLSQYELVLISDSNVSVKPDYLEALMAYRQRGAGLVTQAIFAVSNRNTSSHLDSVHSNTFYLKATAFLSALGHKVVLGKAMLFSKRDLNQVGGLRRTRNYLAEDYKIGQLLKDKGCEVSLCGQLLKQTSVINCWKAYWNRHLRWARLRKSHLPVAYALEIVFFETLWPLLLILCSNSTAARYVGLAALLIQISSNLLIHSRVIQDAKAWSSFYWIPIKDMIVPAIWLGGLLGNTVDWRGTKLHLRPGGTLKRKDIATLAYESSNT